MITKQIILFKQIIFVNGHVRFHKICVYKEESYMSDQVTTAHTNAPGRRGEGLQCMTHSISIKLIHGYENSSRPTIF